MRCIIEGEMFFADVEFLYISVQIITMIFYQLGKMFDAEHGTTNHGIVFPRKERWYSSWDSNPEPSV